MYFVMTTKKEAPSSSVNNNISTLSSFSKFKLVNCVSSESSRENNKVLKSESNIDQQGAHQIMTTITFEELQKYFDYKLEFACQQIGISTTSMKKLCRQFNIPRWPYRKLQSLYIKKDKVLENLKGLNENDENYKRYKSQLEQIEYDINQTKNPNGLVGETNVDSNDSINNQATIEPNTTNNIDEQQIIFSENSQNNFSSGSESFQSLRQPPTIIVRNENSENSGSLNQSNSGSLQSNNNNTNLLPSFKSFVKSLGYENINL
ncbi:hypothetical protein ABK040_006776 [Willaertia magna]